MCRIFLKRLRDVLRIPVLALVDADPYGLKILSVYMKGASHWRTLLCTVRSHLRCRLPMRSVEHQVSTAREVAP